MKRSKLLLLIFLGILIESCSGIRKEKEALRNFELVIVDSLQIDYLGNLRIFDYDSLDHVYLAWGKTNNEVIVLDTNGSITSSFILPTEGPNAIPGWIKPIGIRDGEIQFFAGQDAFYGYSLDGKRKWTFKPPQTYFYLNGINNDPLFPLGKELAFLRPEKGEIDWDGDTEDFFKRIYESPILEVLDTASNKSRLTMNFPPNSVYRDGNFHFWMFPTVSRYGTEWLLYFRNELKFWVYSEKENEVEFQKEVSLDVDEAVLEKGVSFEKIEEYNELTSFDFPGSIQGIYRTPKHILVVYHKGIQQDLARQIDTNGPEGRREIERLKKKYLAVFDLDFKLLQNDILVPEGLIFTTVLTEKNEILALKHPDFFETEGDQVVYYKLKVLNE